MSKFLLLLSVLLLLIVSATSDKPKANTDCDQILSSMMDECKSVRNSLLNSVSIDDSKVTCCLYVSYNTCVQTLKHFTNLAKISPYCFNNKVEDIKVDELELYAEKSLVVETLCDGFEPDSCIFDRRSNGWNSVKTNVRSVNWNHFIKLMKHFGFNISINSQIIENSGPLEIKQIN